MPISCDSQQTDDQTLWRRHHGRTSDFSFSTAMLLRCREAFSVRRTISPHSQANQHQGLWRCENSQPNFHSNKPTPMFAEECCHFYDWTLKRLLRERLVASPQPRQPASPHGFDALSRTSCKFAMPRMSVGREQTKCSSTGDWDCEHAVSRTINSNVCGALHVRVVSGINSLVEFRRFIATWKVENIVQPRELCLKKKRLRA